MYDAVSKALRSTTIKLFTEVAQPNVQEFIASRAI